MANRFDRRRTELSEDALEAAYWEFDARKKGYNRPQQSERDAFKQAIRSRFPQWFSWLNEKEAG
jgi:hypothetical protein